MPAESTFQQPLAAPEHEDFEALLIQWQHRQLGPGQDDVIALDGKRLRGSGGLAIASAVGQPSQRLHATVTLAKQHNKIVAARHLLEKSELTDQLVAVDSLHTQHQTIHPILYDHGADYLVLLKDNQPTVLAAAPTLLAESLSPSGGVGAPALAGRLAM